MASPMIISPSMSALTGRAMTIRGPASSSARSEIPRAPLPGACSVAADPIEPTSTPLVGLGACLVATELGVARPLKQITIDLQGRMGGSLVEVLAMLDLIKQRLVDGERAGAGVDARGTYRFEADFTSTSRHLS
jgi:hypothetical protein